jgi:hypothetical protein
VAVWLYSTFAKRSVIPENRARIGSRAGFDGPKKQYGANAFSEALQELNLEECQVTSERSSVRGSTH